jgi:hypothetical protein
LLLGLVNPPIAKKPIDAFRDRFCIQLLGRYSTMRISNGVLRFFEPVIFRLLKSGSISVLSLRYQHVMVWVVFDHQIARATPGGSFEGPPVDLGCQADDPFRRIPVNAQRS